MELRDWYVKAWTKANFKGDPKREDRDSFTVTELSGGLICLSSDESLQSLKFKKGDWRFPPLPPLTTDDSCCRIFSKPDMWGEYQDLCTDGTSKIDSGLWNSPVRSYFCSSPNVGIIMMD